jgi:hypothetical protein
MVLVIAMGALAGCAATPERAPARPEVPLEITAPPMAVPSPLERATADAALLARWSAGIWRSNDQARRDPAYLDIRTAQTPIWPERGTDGSHWFYVESAQAHIPGEPYRQNVFRLVPQPDGTVRSEQFRLSDAARARVAGSAARGQTPSLTPEDITPIEGCTLTLRRAGDTFTGTMNGQDCRNTFRGADFLDASTRITADLLYTWDRGMRFNGEQVWGPRNGGYEFRREMPPE